MAIYINKEDVPDLDNIPNKVFEYIITKHKKRVGEFLMLEDYYKGKHKILHSDPDDLDKIRVNSNYAKYIVDIALGYYLGEPVKYNGSDSKKKQKKGLSEGVQASVKNGSVSIFDKEDSKEIDIDRLLEVYQNQTVSEADAKIGKYLGIYGEAYELEYANSDDAPEPRTAVYKPINCIMVRDNTVEHNKLFAIVYEQCEDLSENKFYRVTVYNDRISKVYKSTDLEHFEFHEVEGSTEEHYFKEVPVVEYQNNDERQGDFEQVIPLIDALNELLSDRVTDKKKFVNSLLAMFGITLEDDDIKILGKEKFLDGIPLDARIEYIQKTFDENSLNVLCNDIIREIHKMTLTVDMTDESFAGNSSGQALMLKLMTMNMLVKNKMRSFEKGLKKRFEMYNSWLALKKEMLPVDKKEVDVIFTVSMPIDKVEILNTVTQLQGIVDDKTLISQLWFVKDADAVLEAVKKQKEENQKQYLDSFGVNKNENEGFSSYSDKDAQEQEENEKEGGLNGLQDNKSNKENDSTKENSTKAGKSNKKQM